MIWCLITLAGWSSATHSPLGTPGISCIITPQNIFFFTNSCSLASQIVFHPTNAQFSILPNAQKEPHANFWRFSPLSSLPSECAPRFQPAVVH